MDAQKITNRIFAMFVITMFVLLPVYSSNVFAGTIMPSTLTGKQGIPGIRAEKDSLIFNVSVSEPGGTASAVADMIRVLRKLEFRGFQCAETGEGTGMFHCIYEYPEYTSSNSATYRLQLYDSANNPASNVREASIVTDTRAPTVSENDFNVTLVEGKVVAKFSAKDAACYTSECDGKCSGIAEVRFEEGTNNVGTFTNASGCSISDEVQLSIAPSGTQEYSICAVAKDNVGLESRPACKKIIVDLTKPVIDSTVEIRSTAGELVESSKGDPISLASANFNIAEETGLEKVTVTLIGFDSRDGQEAYSTDRTATCSDADSDEIYKCTVGLSGAVMMVDSPTGLKVKINAEDTFGNTAERTIPYSISYDDRGPVFQALATDFRDDLGQFWINESGFSIYASFTDAGSGMSGRKALIDFSPLGSQDVISGSESNTILIANECNEQGNIWICEWNNLKASSPASGAQLPLSVVQAEDDAGNKMDTTGYGVVRVDKTEPEVVYVMAKSIGEDNLEMPLGEGEFLQIFAFIQDYSGLAEVSGNFTNILSLEDFEGVESSTEAMPFTQVAPNECALFEPTTEEDLAIYENFSSKVDTSQDLYVCFWEVGPVKRGYHKDAEYWINAKDLLGHKGTKEETITIYRKLNESEMLDAYWKLTINPAELQPVTGLDRLYWEIASQPVSQPFHLESIAGDAEILSITFGPENCWSGLEYIAGDEATGQFSLRMLGYDLSTDKRDDVFFFMTNPLAVPEISTPVQTTDMVGRTFNTTETIDSINISCQLLITSLVKYGGDKAITLPEIKNFTIEVPVYNNRMGMNLENVKKEIRAMENRVDGSKWLTVLRKIFEYMQAICGIMASLYSIYGVLKTVVDLISGAKVLVKGSVVASGAAGSLEVAQEKAGEATDVADDVFEKGFIGNLYGVLCGLLVQCRVTQGEEQSCTGSDNKKWCEIRQGWQKVNSWYIDSMAKLPFSGANEYAFSKNDFDPKRSIVSSTLTACLPGIISNLEKQRQFLCKKILCYKTEVSNNVPIAKCDVEYSRATCIHWVGQVFMAFPLFQYADQVTKLVQELLSNPWLLLVGYAPDAAIDLACKRGPPGACTAASVLKWGLTIATAVTGIVQSVKGFEYLGCDFCEEALKDQPDPNKAKCGLNPMP